MPTKSEIAGTTWTGNHSWTSDEEYLAHDLGSVLELRYTELGPGNAQFLLAHQHKASSSGYYARESRVRGLPIGIAFSQLTHTFEMAVYSARVCPLIKV